MADSNFRAHRRETVAPRSADVPARGQYDDPLAELARLIGQSEPMGDTDRDPHRFDEAAGGLDWAADDRYAEQNGSAEPNYDGRYDQRYAPESLPDPYPPQGPGVASPGGEYEAETAEFSAPEPRFTAPRDSGRAYTREPARFRDQQNPPEAFARQPAASPPPSEQRYQFDDPMAAGSDDQAYALEDYEDEDAPGDGRRGGLVVVAAVLGLAVLGTAGAFAYRAMFGTSMLPSLPPIIKAEDGPNKIVPSNPKSSSSARADATGPGSTEKLVSREEQPVDMPAPVNPAPRVVSTIPIFPDPNSAQTGMAASGAPTSPAPIAPAPVSPAGTAPPLAPPAPAVAAQLASATPVAPVAALPAAPAPPSIASTEPKKIRTVAIRPDQSAGTDGAAPAPPPAPVRAPPRVAAPSAPRPAPAPHVDENAPLSIVPQPASSQPLPPPPARTQTALAQPMPLSTPAPTAAPAAAGGGYAVQVTSQRSEAEARTEFRALRAKFPNQLGGREPMVRRADLGAKGIFYRALVGPFASMEQAAAMCSSLKAAGGNCIVQHD